MIIVDGEKSKRTHAISLCERGALVLTGIQSIDGFDEENIIMRTSDDDGLSVQGRALHVDKFDAETGDMTVSGSVDAIVYYDVKKRRDRKRNGRFGQG